MKQSKQALVLGMGKSGTAAAHMLKRRGWKVSVADAAGNADIKEKARQLGARGIEALLAAKELPLNDVDLCVVSPGIPLDSDWCRAVREKGVPLTGELELAAGFCQIPLIAVTGSKGKSTAVKLCGDIMKAAGFNVCCGGNYGTPLSTLIDGPLADYFVVECSSFQLESVEKFAPEAAVLLNIQPDHLDRHMTMDRYAEIKRRIFCAMREKQIAVFPVTEKGRINTAARQRTFGKAQPAAAWYDGGVVYSPGYNEISLAGTGFDNGILGTMVAALTLVTEGLGITEEHILKALREYQPLPHRMQKVAEIGGITYVNDSKATSLSALAAGVEMCSGPVHLIAGGRLKEKDLKFVKELLEKRCVGVYVIGEAKKIMMDNWGNSCNCHECGVLEEALRKARENARCGDVILFSPGCASFDQFENFEQRGNRFIEIVNLINEE